MKGNLVRMDNPGTTKAGAYHNLESSTASASLFSQATFTLPCTEAVNQYALKSTFSSSSAIFSYLHRWVETQIHLNCTLHKVTKLSRSLLKATKGVWSRCNLLSGIWPNIGGTLKGYYMLHATIILRPYWVQDLLSVLVLLAIYGNPVLQCLCWFRPKVCVLGSREQLCINQEVMGQESNHVKVSYKCSFKDINIMGCLNCYVQWIVLNTKHWMSATSLLIYQKISTFDRLTKTKHQLCQLYSIGLMLRTVASLLFCSAA